MEEAVKTLNYASKSLSVYGLFDSPLRRRLFTVTYCASMFSFLLGEIIAFFNHNNIDERIEILAYFYSLFCWQMYLIGAMRSEQPRLLQFLSNLVHEQGHGIDDLRVKAVCLAARKVNMLVPKIIFIFALSTAPRAFGWCFTPLLSEFSYENKNFQPIRYLFRCTDEGDNLFPVKFLCCKVDNLAAFVFFNSYISLFYIYGLHVTVPPIIFMVCIRIYVRANITVLKEEVEQSYGDLKCRPSSGPPNDPADDDENESVLSDEERKMMLKKRLRIIIRYHQYIYG